MAASSHQSPLLWIPLKTTDEVDVATPVKSLISSSYGEDPKKYSNALSSLARARTDAVKGAAGSDRTARDLLYKWFHILEMLEVRFPELRVPFTWKDAFTSKPISQFSLAYEKASVIFNIGATLSAMAAATPRLGGSSSADSTTSASSGPMSPASPVAAAAPSGEGDGTKRAYTALRQAAGFFTYINDNFLHAPSTDMSRNLLRFLVPLLLTQANEVFLEKTMGGKSSPGLVAKLANGVAAGYVTAAEDAKEWITKDIVDRIWGMLLLAKAKHYTSLAHYYKAQADIAASQHGHALVRFTVAEGLSKEAVKFAVQFSSNHNSSGPAASAAHTFGYASSTSSASTMPSDAGPSIVGVVQSHLAIVSERRTQAVKDNDLIYHDILPSETTLPAIEKTTPAQPITILETYSSPEVQRAVGPDLFSKLVPLGVHERASMYSEEKAKLARAEAEKCDIAEGERVASLDGMGLPASLEKYRLAVQSGASANGGSQGGWDTLADPGSKVMTWSQEEAAGGAADGASGISPGAAGVRDALAQINSLRAAARGDLSGAAELLDEESRLCEKARAKHGLRWAQEPSGGQTRVKDMRSEIKGNKEALNQAEDNDRRIQSKWAEVERDVELLVRGRGALEQAFAEAVTSSVSGGAQTAAPSLLDLSEPEEETSTDELSRLRRDVETIDSNLVKLSKIKRERDTVLAELREKLQSDDIGHLLILCHRGGGKNAGGAADNDASNSGDSSDNPEQAAREAMLFRHELEKFKPWQQRLSMAVTAQGHLLHDISQAWQSLNGSAEGKRIGQQWDARQRGREALVARLGAAHEASAEVRAALGKGLQFYEEASGIAKGLKTSARQWSDERGRERQRMESEAEWEGKLDSNGADDLTRGMGSMGLGNNSANVGSRSSSGAGPMPPPLPPSARQSSFTFSDSNGTSARPSYGSQTSAYPNSSAPPNGQSYGGLPPPPPRPIGQSFGPASPASPGPYSPAPAPARAPSQSYSSAAPGASYGSSQGSNSGPSLPPPPSQPYYSSFSSVGQSSPYNYGYGGAASGPRSPAPAPPPPPPSQLQQYGHQAPPAPYATAAYPTSSQSQSQAAPSSAYGQPSGGMGYGGLPSPPPSAGTGNASSYGYLGHAASQGQQQGYGGAAQRAGGGPPPPPPPPSATSSTTPSQPYQQQQQYPQSQQYQYMPPPPPQPQQQQQQYYGQPQQPQQYSYQSYPQQGSNAPPPHPQQQQQQQPWRGY